MRVRTAFHPYRFFVCCLICLSLCCGLLPSTGLARPQERLGPVDTGHPPRQPYPGAPHVTDYDLPELLPDSAPDGLSSPPGGPQVSTAAGWVTIMTENFEGAFPSAGWEVLGDPTWDDDNYKPHGGGRSAWCANGGTGGRDPAYNDYANNMSAWMIYGPFDLSDASAAEFTFYYWLDTEQDYDWFLYRASSDRAYWGEYKTSGSSGDQWRYRQFNLCDVPGLGNLCGQPQVWIAFKFESDGSVTNQGVFVDDITLRKQVSTPPPGGCIIETPHPYGPYYSQDWVLTNADTSASSTRIHFSRIELCDDDAYPSDTDRIIIRDGSNRVIEEIRSSHPSGYWSQPVPGRTVKVQIMTDGDCHAWGFCIDQVGDVPTPSCTEDPYINDVANADCDGDYQVTWREPSSAQPGTTIYVLQEATRADMVGRREVYRGSGHSAPLQGRSPGTYYYRLKYINPDCESAWSDPPRSVLVCEPEDTSAPTISSVRADPQSVNREGCGSPERVTIYAEVTDDQSGVARVELHYQAPGEQWQIVQMSAGTGSTYYATVGPFGYAGTLRCQVRAFDQAGNDAYSTPALEVTVDDCAPPDTTPPMIYNVRASPSTVNRDGCPAPNRVTISASIIDDQSGLGWARLHYQPPGGSWTSVAMPYTRNGSYSASVTIGPFANAGVLRYYIEAGDLAGNEGPSGQYTVTVDDCCALAPPVLNSIDNADCDGDYTLTWTPVPGATEYWIRYSDNAAMSPSTLLWPAWSDTWRNVTAPSPGTWYYQVRADTEQCVGEYSNVQSVRVWPVPPKPTLQPIVNPGQSSSYDVTWLPVADADRYEYMESQNPSFVSAAVRSTTATRLSMSGKAPGQWYYQVRACNCRGCGPWSDVQSTAVAATDLVATRLEITQAVQDLQNSVRLVANKRTFVRFHVRSDSGVHRTTATLRVQSGPHFVDLLPTNLGGDIFVQDSPDRGTLDHAFLFEVPTGFTQGTVTFTALLNPHHNPEETNYGNNSPPAVTRSFETVHPLDLVIYRFGYRLSGTDYWPPETHVGQLINWLWRAYPIPIVNFQVRDRMYGDATVIRSGTQVTLTSPGRAEINSMLEAQQTWDWNDSYWVWYLGAHYYGMVDDRGGFLQGLAAGIPSYVATGPTGTGTWGWDTDGSYGDWYGGHELGHTFGRRHPGFCDQSRDSQHPSGDHPNGRISPSLTGDSAIYGFDIGTGQIYPPDWHDVMTYCDFLWISDFTYEGLMDFMQDWWTPQTVMERRLLDQTDRLLVTGSIDPTTHQVDLQPLFIIPDAGDLQPRVPGSYALVLRSASGAELARYPFTPDEATLYPAMGPTAHSQADDRVLLISELVPFVDGTTRVDLQGPGGGLLESVRAGASPPMVTVTAPNGGEFLDGDPIVVTWTASDPDGDPLTFNVQYSHDNGENWQMVAQNVTNHSTQIAAINIPGGQQALFRVWASDGLHTSSDQSDAPFTVPNHVPIVEIESPASGKTIVTDQTLNLQAYAYDMDTGSMDQEQLEWHSSIDGFLGNGTQLSITGLRVGNHSITLWADDGEGGTATDMVKVTVVRDISELPQHRVFLPLIIRQFRPGPKWILFDEAHGEDMTLSWERAQVLLPEHPGWIYCGRMQADLAGEFTLLRNPDAPLTAQLLAGYDAVILASPQEEVTPAERQALEQFMRDGGGVLWLGGSEWVVEQFIHDKGIHYDGHVLFEINGDGDFEVTHFAAHPAVAGVTRMVTNWGGSLEVDWPAVPLATTPADIFRDQNDNYQYDFGEPTRPFTIAAGYESGKTRLVFVSGSPFQDHGYDWRNNTPFMRALLRWLTGTR